MRRRIYSAWAVSNAIMSSEQSMSALVHESNVAHVFGNRKKGMRGDGSNRGEKGSTKAYSAAYAPRSMLPTIVAAPIPSDLEAPFAGPL